MTPAEFRATPIGKAFANTTTFPDGDVTFWLDIAAKSLRETVWTSDFLNLATALFVAHYLSLDAQAARGAAGGVPGVGGGVVSSKTVGSVSVSYDVGAAMDPRAKHWNLTSYGVRLWAMIRMAGMGGVQI